MSRSQFFFKCLNATILLTYTLANEYPSSDEISKKNGMVRGGCIACDALFFHCFSEKIRLDVSSARRGFT